jgi:hypothetical protein
VRGANGTKTKEEFTMTTRTNHPNARSRAGQAALLLGILLVAGACVHVERRRTDHQFDIGFERGCPRSVKVEPSQRNCPILWWYEEDCVRVGRGDEVRFVAWPKGPANDFKVYLDPSQPHEAKDGSVTITIEPGAPYKEYMFSVVSKECPVLDPTIIVEH